MTLHSPAEFSQIVDMYICGWRMLRFMPECRSNNLPGWTQGGSSGYNIVAQFAVNYHKEAKALGIDLEELYFAMITDGDVTHRSGIRWADGSTYISKWIFFWLFQLSKPEANPSLGNMAMSFLLFLMSVARTREGSRMVEVHVSCRVQLT